MRDTWGLFLNSIEMFSNLKSRSKISNFTTTAEIHARSLANFYCQYADRQLNLKFVRRVSEREREIRQSVIVKKNWCQFLLSLSCY